LHLIKEKILVRQKRTSIFDYLKQEFPKQKFNGRIEYVEHHLAHLSSAYSVSPFKQASIISVDGFGDFASTAFGFGNSQKIELQNRIYFPHSLGIFYQALPRQRDQALTQHHKDLARSVQDCYERTFFHMLNSLYKKHKTDNLTIAGGCGMNSVANGKVHLHTPFGGAIGAAIIAGQRNGVEKVSMMSHAYWGPSFSDDALSKVVDTYQSKLMQADCEIHKNINTDTVCEQVSDYIIEGKESCWLVSRFDGMGAKSFGESFNSWRPSS